jgi:aminopeptidase N
LLKEVTPVINGKHTFKWESRYPIAHYLVAFVCSTFDTFTTYWKYSATDSLAIQNFVYPGQVESWRNGLKMLPDILDAYQEWFGPYPFLKEKYGHAQWRGGGMENQTISFVNSFDTGLIAHEAAHQWWGDAITCATWNEIWLNEGFATYYTSRYVGRSRGEQAYRVDMAQKERFITVVPAGEKPAGSVFVYDSSLADVGRVFSGRSTYDKGAWVLHMLNYVLGDSTFDATMKSWMMGPKRYGTATTPEFVKFVEAQTGRSLQQFFTQWVFAEGYPQYQFSPQTSPYFGGQWRSVIYLDQTPSKTPVFYAMPVQVRVEGDGWDSLIVLNNTQSGQFWDMIFDKEPKRWIFDPFNNILDGRVDQYLTVASSSSEGIFLLQPNPVKRGEPLRMTLSQGYSLRGFEVIDTRGVSMLRDNTMRSDSAISLPVEMLAAGAYSIRVSVMDDHGEAIERVEKFIVE